MRCLLAILLATRAAGFGVIPHHEERHLSLHAGNIHWGYFSKDEPPKMYVESGATVTVEMASHHACDDYDKMVLGDPGMESVFAWDELGQAVSRRGATGGGDGVHVLTGPIYVEDAEPGDILMVEILDLAPRPNKDGKTFGSNAAAWWGYQMRNPKADGEDYTAGAFTGTPGESDEVVTIYELYEEDGESFATLAYQFEWPTITDPGGTVRDYIAYPGTCVPHDYAGFSSTVSDMGWTKADAITYMNDPYKAKARPPPRRSAPPLTRRRCRRRAPRVAAERHPRRFPPPLHSHPTPHLRPPPL